MKYRLKNNHTNNYFIVTESEYDDYLTKIIEGLYQVEKVIPENVEDEDYINGHYYPGHECWPDSY